MPRDLSKQTLCLGVSWLIWQLAATGQDQLIVQPAAPAGTAPAVSSAGADQAAWREAMSRGDATKAGELVKARPGLAFGLSPNGKGWLHLAAEDGHEGIVAMLITAKVDLDRPGDRRMTGGSGQTALHIAAFKGHASIARLLLEAGANVNARAFSRNTPLQIALQPSAHYQGTEQLAYADRTNRTGRIETVRLLCLSGADIFATNSHRNPFNSALRAASTPGQEQWLDLLLTNARPRTVRDPDGRSLLDIARQHERFDALLALALPEAAAPAGQLNPLQALVFHSPPGPRQADGARLEPRGYWILASAGHAPDLFTRVGLEDFAGVKEWLRDNPGQLARLRDAEGRSPLHWALTKGFADMAALLLEHGADASAVDASGRTPLLLMVETDQLVMLQRLKALATRALNDDTFPLSPLELALIKGQSAMADALLEMQPEVNRPCLTGGTLLHLAARKASVSVTEKLLALGVDPKLRDARQRTPLHLAVTSGNALHVDALLKGGAPLDAEDEDGRLPSHEAARLGHAELLPKLLPPAAFVHRPDKSGRTPLELAVQGGHEGAADFLLRQKPDLNRRGAGGMTLLHLATQSGRADLVLRLLTAGADAAVPDERGRTPLHAAAERGHTDALIKLVNARAPLTTRDRDGKTALELALGSGHTPAARVLLQLGNWKPDATARQTTPLHTAAAAGQLDFVQELAALSPTPDLLDEQGQTPLALAGGGGHFPVIKLLVELGANVNATNAAGQTPLLLALMRENWSQALALLELRADLNRADTNGNTALHLAFKKGISNTAASGWWAEFERLMRTNALPTNTTFSAWLRTNDPLALLEKEIAARRTDGKAFDPQFDQVWQEPWKFVLAAGADTKATNRLGQTPLHSLGAQDYFYSSTHGSRIDVIVAALVRRGADPNARDAAGRTALHEAAKRGRWQIVQSLVHHGADVNASTREGLTAAHFALQEPWPHRGVSGVLQSLVQLGEDLNARDTNGQTLLHHFSRFGRGDLDMFTGPAVAEFLKAKPDVNAQDHQGDTPLHLAVRAGRGQLANQLNSHGANPLLRNKAGESAMELVAKLPGSPYSKPNLLPPGAKASPQDAAAAGDLDSLKAWFAYDPNSVVQSNTAANPLLNDAASNRHTNVVNFLLTNGVRLTPFVALITGRQAELARLLRDDPQSTRTQWRHARRVVSFTNGNSWGTSSYLPALAPILHHAVALTNEAAVNLVLAAMPEVNAADTDGFTALYHSLTNGTVGLTALLRKAGVVENGFDLVALDRPEDLKPLAKVLAAEGGPNQTVSKLLRFAVQRANLPAAKVLLAAGADPNESWPGQFRMPQSSPMRPLHVAVALEQVELAQALIAGGAEVNCFEESGLSPLHLSAWRGQPAMIALLLKHGAEPNARAELSPEMMRRPLPFRSGGLTPLHLAAHYGQTNSIALLVRAGADLERTNHYGQTPLGMLRNTGRPGQMMPPSFFFGGFPSRSIGGFQRQPPTTRASQEGVIHLLRSLGAKEPAAIQPFVQSPFGPPRPVIPAPAPSANAAPVPAVPAKPPEPKPRE